MTHPQGQRVHYASNMKVQLLCLCRFVLFGFSMDSQKFWRQREKICTREKSMSSERVNFPVVLRTIISHTQAHEELSASREVGRWAGGSIRKEIAFCLRISTFSVGYPPFFRCLDCPLSRVIAATPNHTTSAPSTDGGC